MQNKIVTCAREWIGTPYRHQASLKQVGCDCLGLVRGVWREVIGPEPQDIPPYSADWAEANQYEALYEAGKQYFSEIAFSQSAPGDVVLFRWRQSYPAKHIAILSDGNHMIHAHDGAKVSEVFLSSWWYSKLAYCFRFPQA